MDSAGTAIAGDPTSTVLTSPNQYTMTFSVDGGALGLPSAGDMTRALQVCPIIQPSTAVVFLSGNYCDVTFYVDTVGTEDQIATTIEGIWQQLYPGLSIYYVQTAPGDGNGLAHQDFQANGPSSQCGISNPGACASAAGGAISSAAKNAVAALPSTGNIMIFVGLAVVGLLAVAYISRP